MRYAIEPCPKPRMTQRDKWKKRPCVMKYRAFKDKCRLFGVSLPQPCRVIFHMPLPKKMGQRARQSMLGKPHTIKPDLDNLLKAICDAVLMDDSRLWSIHAEKRWSPSAGIEIIPIEDSAPKTTDSPSGSGS